MLTVFVFALMTVLAVNILSELRAVIRSERRLRKDSALPHKAYDWKKEKVYSAIIPFDDIAREQRKSEDERRYCSEICFLDACANFGEGPAKHVNKIVLFNDIKKA